MDEFFSHVLYPVIATPKYDGIRCTSMMDYRDRDHISRPVCRSLDDVPNILIFNQLASTCPPGPDGEILTYNQQQDLLTPVDLTKPRKFYEIQSDVMSQQGTPVFKFHVFDYYPFEEKYPHLVPYEKRLSMLANLKLPDSIILAPLTWCKNREELEAFEAKCVEELGYEGICWRHPLSRYKYGRSTLREQALIKMKRFSDDEAVIIGAYEEMGNNNPQTQNALGYAERSSHKVNMSPKGRLGGFTLKSSKFDMEFNCGSGFDAEQRVNYWSIRDSLIGQVVKFKHQPHGGKDRPRIPIFLGLRDKRDS